MDDLLSYLKKYGGITKIVLFGSRARGDNSERSDYDIAIFGGLTYEEQNQIRYYCNEVLRTLHKVDLIFVSPKTYPPLKENIQKEGIVLYGQS